MRHAGNILPHVSLFSFSVLPISEYPDPSLFGSLVISANNFHNKFRSILQKHHIFFRFLRNSADPRPLSSRRNTQDGSIPCAAVFCTEGGTFSPNPKKHAAEVEFSAACRPYSFLFIRRSASAVFQYHCKRAFWGWRLLSHPPGRLQ